MKEPKKRELAWIPVYYDRTHKLQPPREGMWMTSRMTSVTRHASICLLSLKKGKKSSYLPDSGISANPYGESGTEKYDFFHLTLIILISLFTVDTGLEYILKIKLFMFIYWKEHFLCLSFVK